MRPRGGAVFLHSRQTSAALLGLVGVGVLGFATRQFEPVLFGWPNRLSAVSVVFAPAAAAVVVAASLDNAHVWMDRVAPRGLGAWRAAHVVALAVMTLVALAPGIPSADPSSQALLARNVLGMQAMSLAMVLGGAGPLAWAPPTVMVAAVFLLGRLSAEAPAWWAWPLHEGGQTSLWVSLGCWAVLLLVYARRGPGQDA